MKVTRSVSSCPAAARAESSRGSAASPYRSPGEVGAPVNRDRPADVRGQQRRAQRTAPTIGVAEDVGRGTGLVRESRGDRRQILEFALDGVGRGVTRRSPAAAIDRVDREPGSSNGPRDPERGVVGGRAVHEDQRRPHAGGEHRDRCSVRRGRGQDGLVGRVMKKKLL